MDDPGFVDRLRRGDDATWRAFLESHGSLILAVAARTGLDGDEREDLFQETCVACLRSLHTLRDTRRLSSWVYMIAYHLAIDFLRRRRLFRSPDPADPLGDLPDQADPSPDVLAELEQLEQAAHLRDRIAGMDLRCRQLLTMLYLVDPTPSYAEISRRAEIPIGSIGPTRARCLEKLRDLLEPISNAPSATSIGRSRARAISGVGELNPPSAGPRGPDQAGCK